MHPSEAPSVKDAWASRRRRHRITTAGVSGFMATAFIVWLSTLWPGAALVAGAVVGPIVAFVYKLLYDCLTARSGRL